MRMKYGIIASLLTSVFTLMPGQDPPSVVVDINVDVKHLLGDNSTFEREKFITIHSGPTEGDWNGNNFTPDLKDHFLNGYDVYMGRNTGSITWTLNNQAVQDPARPGHVSASNMQALGLSSRNNYEARTTLHPYEARNNLILCAQLHPFWPDGKLTHKGWALSQSDSSEEPFGTATGEYMGLYLKNFFGSQGQPHPAFVEIINEPLWDLVTNGTTPPAKIFDFHNNVANAIRDIQPGIPIGGYVAAFTDFEVRDFERWNERWKLFIDMAGSNMDFFSFHMYDFPSIGGKQLYRKGSKMEATFDMLEQYSMITLGAVKPILISEYGAQTHDYNNDPWTPYRDWLRLKSINSMVMQYMERSNHILSTIPFTVVKAEWGRNPTTGIPYGPRLMRQAFEADGETGEQWVYTDLVKFYQLWADVNGSRVDSKSTDVDILTDAFVDGNTAYVIVNNLEFNPRNIGFSTMGADSNPIRQVTVKHLHLKGSTPILDTSIFAEIPVSIILGSEATAIMEVQYENPVAIPDSSREVKLYADTYLKDISSGNQLIFNINGITKANWGEAVLRLGLGRDHGKSLAPEVAFNDSVISVPEDFRGGDQAQREQFFGVIEIPVPYEILKDSNRIGVTFQDNGGHISSVALQTYAFSREITRSERPTKFNVHLTVTDKNTGAPVAGSEVLFNSIHYVTNEAGQLQIDTIQEGTYDLSVNALNYQTYTISDLLIDDNKHLNIRLESELFEVEFQILEEVLKAPVSNAQITAGSALRYSDEAGKSLISLSNGNVAVSVEREYFTSYSGEVSIHSDTIFIIHLQRINADAKFRVWSHEGALREANALVTVGDSSITTNILGLATFKALKVDTAYHYSISKDGFELFADELVLKTDTAIEVNLLLHRDEYTTGMNGLSLYPIPPQEYLYVTWFQKEKSPVTITISDMFGRNVITRKAEGFSGENHTVVDLTEIEQGFYFITLRDGKKSVSGKFYTH